jgi:hypothetical protein
MDSRDRSGWPFDQAQNVAAISSKKVLFDGAPVLFVVHYSDDHSWAFLEGQSFRASEGSIVSMATAVRNDLSLYEIADLPPGWVASRAHVGAPWIRERDPEV